MTSFTIQWRQRACIAALPVLLVWRGPRTYNFTRLVKMPNAPASGRANAASRMPPSLLAQNIAKVADVCRLIENSEEAPNLEQLSEHAGLSVFHFHRLFKTATGLTPRQYAAAHRAERVRRKLSESSTVTQAIYDAGYNSNGRFYEESNEVLGMTPSDFRSGGARTDIRFAVGECSLGSILVAKSDRGICAILLGDDPDGLTRDLQDRFPEANLIGGDAAFEQLVAKVVGFIEAPAIGLDLPLDVRGTAFQQRVWQVCVRFRRAPPQAMPILRRRSDRRDRFGQSPRHAPPTRWRWPFLAIG